MRVGLTGCNLVGQSLSRHGSQTFCAINPTNNKSLEPIFFIAGNEEIQGALEKATFAFPILQEKSGSETGHLLRAIKNELELNAHVILLRYQLESGLTAERAQTEFNRTILQIDQFIELAESNSWREPSIDMLQNRSLIATDLRKMNVGIGPVLVFGASNFPLAYSTAGTDSISALAAGCPVIVKAHPYHPGSSELVAQCIRNAIEKSDFPDGTFSHLFDDAYSIAETLVKDKRIKAVGFTGSQTGGRALFDLANSRPDPIPVFAEMGSTNPIVVFRDLLKEKTVEWANAIAESVTNGAGQFCTKPGLIFCLASPETTLFIDALIGRISEVENLQMIHPNLKENYLRKVQMRSESIQNRQAEAFYDDVKSLVLTCSANQFTADASLQTEVFGPFALVVIAETVEELNQCIELLEGQLTGSVLGSFSELEQNSETLKLIRSKVGRVILNGVPTGVTVCPSMHHGGPFPASTDSRFSSVGIDAIKRFVRPQSFQNWPNELLPSPLRNENPLNISRRVDGKWTFAEIKQ
jgi:NADP-dependent aldehyde dehydrogenase